MTGEKQSLDRGHLPEREAAGQGRAAGPRPAVSGPRGREGSTWQFQFPQEAAPRWGQPLELQTRKPGSRGQS